MALISVNPDRYMCWLQRCKVMDKVEVEKAQKRRAMHSSGNTRRDMLDSCSDDYAYVPK